MMMGSIKTRPLMANHAPTPEPFGRPSALEHKLAVNRIAGARRHRTSLGWARASLRPSSHAAATVHATVPSPCYANAAETKVLVLLPNLLLLSMPSLSALLPRDLRGCAPCCLVASAARPCGFGRLLPLLLLLPAGRPTWVSTVWRRCVGELLPCW